jgi:NAD(P)-dependent dehydrogenase (short-subunit alcohol dehydrogenase family)
LLTLAGQVGDSAGALADEVGARGLVADLSSRDGVLLVAEACGDVDVLVVNAGVPGSGEVTGYSLDEVDRVLDVHLRGPILLSRVVGERMVARGSGHIVFVSSLSGKAVGAFSSLGSAAMFGLRGFALGLRQEWAPRGVGVSCVNIGAIGVPEALREAGGALPAGFRPKTPSDVAAAVVKAVKHDRAEVDVADPVRRAGVVFGQVAPQVAARLNRLAGTDQPADTR